MSPTVSAASVLALAAIPSPEPSEVPPAQPPAAAKSAALPTYDPPRSDCVLCGGTDLRAYDRDHRGHRIVRCATCGVRFMNPQYSDAWLEHFYSAYVPASGHSHTNGWRARPEVRRIGKLRALQDVGRFCRPGRALMVGCGDGLELEVARELGWQVCGHDVDPDTTARVAASLGVEVHCGHFPDLDVPDGSFDLVYMDQVIEHPKEPGPFLDKAARLLRPGGVLYLGQPNITSLSNHGKTLLGRLGLRERRRGRHYASQHHITYYTPGVLKRHLRRQLGLEVVAVLGSPKPSRRPWLDGFARRFAVLDSSFVVIARRPVV